MRALTYRDCLRAAIRRLQDAFDSGIVPDADEAELLEMLVVLQRLLTRKAEK